jgi:hypothetical protein
VDEQLRDDVDCAFIYQGNVKPISEEFYEHARDAGAIGENLSLVAFAGLIAAVIAYSILLDLSGKGKAEEGIVMLGAILLPRGDDPFLTRAGKLCWLIRIASRPWLQDTIGTVFGLYPMPPDPGGQVSRVAETAYVEFVWRTITVSVAAALLLAFVWGCASAVRTNQRAAKE